MKIELIKEETITGIKYWIYVNDICESVQYTEEEALKEFDKNVEFFSKPKKRDVIKSIEII